MAVYPFYLFDDAGGQLPLEVFVTGHLDGVHAGYAVVGVVASAAHLLFVFHAVDKVGLVDEGTPHLYKLESVVEHLVDGKIQHGLVVQ